MWSQDNILYCTSSLYFAFWRLIAHPVSFWLVFASTESTCICTDMSLDGPRCVWKLWWKEKCINRSIQWLFSKDRTVCFPVGSSNDLCTHKQVLLLCTSYFLQPWYPERAVFMYSLTVRRYITFFILLTLKEDYSASSHFTVPICLDKALPAAPVHCAVWSCSPRI
jgi:hypothetical protein